MKDIINGFLITPPEVSFSIYPYPDKQLPRWLFRWQISRDGAAAVSRRCATVKTRRQTTHQRLSRHRGITSEKKIKENGRAILAAATARPPTDEDSPHYNIIKDHHRHLSGLQVKHAGHPKASGLPNINPENHGNNSSVWWHTACPLLLFQVASSSFSVSRTSLSHTPSRWRNVGGNNAMTEIFHASSSHNYTRTNDVHVDGSNSLVASSPFLFVPPTTNSSPLTNKHAGFRENKARNEHFVITNDYCFHRPCQTGRLEREREENRSAFPFIRADIRPADPIRFCIFHIYLKRYSSPLAMSKDADNCQPPFLWDWKIFFYDSNEWQVV